MVLPIPRSAINKHPILIELSKNSFQPIEKEKNVLRILIWVHTVLMISFLLTPYPFHCLIHSMIIFAGYVATSGRVPIQYAVFNAFAIFCTLMVSCTTFHMFSNSSANTYKNNIYKQELFLPRTHEVKNQVLFHIFSRAPDTSQTNRTHRFNMFAIFSRVKQPNPLRRLADSRVENLYPSYRLSDSRLAKLHPLDRLSYSLRLSDSQRSNNFTDSPGYNRTKSLETFLDFPRFDRKISSNRPDVLSTLENLHPLNRRANSPNLKESNSSDSFSISPTFDLSKSLAMLPYSPRLKKSNPYSTKGVEMNNTNNDVIPTEEENNSNEYSRKLAGNYSVEPFKWRIELEKRLFISCSIIGLIESLLSTYIVVKSISIIRENFTSSLLADQDNFETQSTLLDNNNIEFIPFSGNPISLVSQVS